jgi:hypothetical protein
VGADLETEVWAIPGFVAPSPARSGATPIGGYTPEPSPKARELIAALRDLGDVGDLVAVAHQAAVTLSRHLLAHGSGAGWRGEALDQIVGLVETSNAVQAATRELVGQTDRAGTASIHTRTGLSTWLGLRCNLTRAQAQALVLNARKTHRFELLRRAAADGVVNRWQVQAVVDVLANLPYDLDATRAAAAEQSLVDKAQSMGSDQLTRQGENVLEEVAPEIAQQAAEQRAARQLRRATSKQFFKVCDNHDGTTTLKGLVPTLEGERLRAVIEKAAEKIRRERAHAPDGRLMDRGQARAAALIEIATHVQSCGHAQPLGAAPARLVVTIKAEDLTDPGMFGMRLAVGGDVVDSRTAAQLACDCEMVRVVLGPKSQVLDVGRATRVIPAGLRVALAARDRGCCFPGCDRPPEVCEGHHVAPWRRGGSTSLSNLCLLCPTHHRLVEPPRDGPPGWEARLRGDGLWEFLPPTEFDPERAPLLHHRFHQPGGPVRRDAHHQIHAAGGDASP